MAECEVDHSPPSSAEVKNGWSYNSTPHIHLHGLDRGNYILYPVYTCSKCVIFFFLHVVNLSLPLLLIPCFVAFRSTK